MFYEIAHCGENLTKNIFHQVMDHTDNLIQLSNDLANFQTDIDEIEDRTTAAETNIILLESEIEVLDTRASDVEQILYGKRVPVCTLSVITDEITSYLIYWLTVLHNIFQWARTFYKVNSGMSWTWLCLVCPSHQAEVVENQNWYLNWFFHLFPSETKNSAFYAALTVDVVFEAQQQIIVFDNDKINEGGHYNTTTGVYTAPVTGIYQFFVYIRSTPKANFHLRVDGSLYINTIENYDGEAEGGEQEAEGASVIVRLQAGQIVHVTTGSEPYTVDGHTDGRFTFFGGYLLFPETE